ncbi:hypothetical protein EDB86DRAFT_2957965 [Lactarius hatsudake]|nr:hypothetical protein EDB86DRAFT_2957965 [Lactarius hatsudake]
MTCPRCDSRWYQRRCFHSSCTRECRLCLHDLDGLAARCALKLARCDTQLRTLDMAAQCDTCLHTLDMTTQRTLAIPHMHCIHSIMAGGITTLLPLTSATFEGANDEKPEVDGAGLEVEGEVLELNSGGPGGNGGSREDRMSQGPPGPFSPPRGTRLGLTPIATSPVTVENVPTTSDVIVVPACSAVPSVALAPPATSEAIALSTAKSQEPIGASTLAG